MGKTLPRIEPDLAAWLEAQKLFFVSTAPLSKDGLINLSPKGGDSFRVTGPMEVVYQDYTGSGAETAAHLRENGRITIMFCAFAGPPRIVRLYGRGEMIGTDHPRFPEFEKLFPPHPTTRAFYLVTLTRISSSCGWTVPLLGYEGERDQMREWAEKKGPEGIVEYRAQKNKVSIEGLPAFDA